MSKYKGGRRGGAAVVALGWVIVALPVLAMMFVIASVLGAQLGPVIAAALLPSAVVAGLAGLVLVLLGHVAAAVFDIADSKVPTRT